MFLKIRHGMKLYLSYETKDGVPDFKKVRRVSIPKESRFLDSWVVEDIEEMVREINPSLHLYSISVSEKYYDLFFDHISFYTFHKAEYLSLPDQVDLKDQEKEESNESK